jgi:arginyl-tRNA synthetase
LFGNEHKKQTNELIQKGMSKEEAEKEAPIMKAAQQMLVDWEAGKPDVIELWKKMNSWVYAGFAETYKRIGSDFDKTYYESETYILGKQLVQYGLKNGVFYTKDDNSVWIDLTADGLDEKIVQRKDGTAVYITQDIGLAVEKYNEFKCDDSIYVVGDEQNYHFKVLKLICQKLKLASADGIYHLSYGMVELPTGRMKTREGTVVDADEIVDEMTNVAKQKTEELGKVKDFTQDELNELYDTIGLGALKFFLLRVEPKKKMLFNPEESIDFHGFTGPFVQYTYARIKSILRKLEIGSRKLEVGSQQLLKLEKDLIVMLEQYPQVIEDAATGHNPSLIAIYVFNLAKLFNSFYTEHSISNAESEDKKQLRLSISVITAAAIKNGMRLLGIKVPERM